MDKQRQSAAQDDAALLHIRLVPEEQLQVPSIMQFEQNMAALVDQLYGIGEKLWQPVIEASQFDTVSDNGRDPYEIGEQIRLPKHPKALDMAELTQLAAKFSPEQPQTEPIDIGSNLPLRTGVADHNNHTESGKGESGAIEAQSLKNISYQGQNQRGSTKLWPQHRGATERIDQSLPNGEGRLKPLAASANEKFVITKGKDKLPQEVQFQGEPLASGGSDLMSSSSLASKPSSPAQLQDISELGSVDALTATAQEQIAELENENARSSVSKLTNDSDLATEKVVDAIAVIEELPQREDRSKQSMAVNASTPDGYSKQQGSPLRRFSERLNHPRETVAWTSDDQQEQQAQLAVAQPLMEVGGFQLASVNAENFFTAASSPTNLDNDTKLDSWMGKGGGSENITSHYQLMSPQVLSGALAEILEIDYRRHYGES